MLGPVRHLFFLPYFSLLSPTALHRTIPPAQLMFREPISRHRLPRHSRLNAKRRPTLPLTPLDHHCASSHGREQRFGLFVLVLGRAVLPAQRLVRTSLPLIDSYPRTCRAVQVPSRAGSSRSRRISRVSMSSLERLRSCLLVNSWAL